MYVIWSHLFTQWQVFPKVNWGWMDIWSSNGVRINRPRIKFTGHSHTSQRRYSDSYWSFGQVMNNLLLDQTNFYWTLPHVRQTLGMTAMNAHNIIQFNSKLPWHLVLYLANIWNSCKTYDECCNLLHILSQLFQKDNKNKTLINKD